MTKSCPRCWAHLQSPLFCESCEEILEPENAVSPYDVLGFEHGYALDRMTLRKRLLHLSRHLHPDVHGTADPALRERAQRNTAELNAAFEILDDDFHRADWLVKSLGGPGEVQERQMPPEFLAEVMEWNEAVEEAGDAAPGAPERARLDDLEQTLLGEREELMAVVAAALTPLPEMRSPKLTEVRRKLNAVRYLDRTLHTISELRLSQAASRP